MLDLRRTVEVLERTPATLRALLAGLSNVWIAADEGPETFSPADVVGHLLHGEAEDWIPRLRIILLHGRARPFTPFDRFGFLTRNPRWTLEEMLDAFEAARRDSLDALRTLELTEEQLDREGTHPELGTVTVGQLLATWAVHDLGHVGQIVRVMAKRYEGEVGPWADYLPVLGH